MDLGFVGIGKMGRPMAERLLERGNVVRVFNRSAAAAEQLRTKGAIVSASLQEIAKQSEIVFTALPTNDSVEEVYLRLVEWASPDQIFVDCSTVPLGLNRQCARLLEDKGARFLDAPVSGGPGGAAAGTLTVMVGGDPDIFERALPTFECFGKVIRLCGPVGAGQAVKLVNQLLVGVHTAAIAEAAVFGAKLGADPAVLLELIAPSFGGSAMLTRNLPRFISRDFTAATPIQIIFKDLGVIHDEARRCSVPVVLGALAEQFFLEAAARGWSGDDMAALVRLWEEPAGITLGGAKAT